MSDDPQEEARRRLTDAVRERAGRRRRWLRGGADSIGRNLGQIGALGWTIVLPTLAGLGAGRWLDHRMGTRIFFTAPLMLVGLALGCWLGWRWINRR